MEDTSQASSFDEKLLTKAALAQRLGVGIKEINRRLRTGALREYRKRAGALYFHPSQVEEQKLLSKSRPNTKKEHLDTVEYSGDEAAVVFRALGEGKTLLSIVIESCLHPAVVEAAARAFAQLQGGLHLGAASLREMEKLPMDGEFPIQSEQQFVEMLRSALEEAACGECQKKTRKVCLACARNLARKGRKTEDGED